MRSASSTTTNVARVARDTSPASTKSSRRPGVATMISHVFLRNSFCCGARGAPPYTATVVILLLAAYA